MAYLASKRSTQDKRRTSCDASLADLEQVCMIGRDTVHRYDRVCEGEKGKRDKRESHGRNVQG